MVSPTKRSKHRPTPDIDADDFDTFVDPVGHDFRATQAARVEHVSTPALHPAAHPLASMFGLDVRAAVLVILVDVMVFGADVVSVGTLLPLSIVVSGALGVIVYKIQTHWYGDDKTSALIKSLIVALLTAIPVPLSPLVALPGGLIGVIRSLKRQ